MYCSRKIKDLKPGDHVRSDQISKFLGFIDFKDGVAYDISTYEKIRDLLSLDCNERSHVVFQNNIIKPPIIKKISIHDDIHVIYPKFELGCYVDNDKSMCRQILAIDISYYETFVYTLDDHTIQFEHELTKNGRPYVDPTKIPATIEELYRLFNKTINEQQKMINRLERLIALK